MTLEDMKNRHAHEKEGIIVKMTVLKDLRLTQIP